MTACRTCELLARRDRNEAPLWDAILRTPHWDVVHSFDTSLPGWPVLIARRHVPTVGELTEAEALACGRLQRDVSIALTKVTGCAKTYIVQFAESPEHPHVHFHVIPRMLDMADGSRGPGVFRHLGVPLQERVPESVMNDLATRIQAELQPMWSFLARGAVGASSRFAHGCDSPPEK